MTDLPPFC